MGPLSRAGNVDSVRNFGLRSSAIGTMNRWFWIFAAVWTLLWTLLPWGIQPSPGLTDTFEPYLIGREWVWGSIKHPPLPFWFLEIVYQGSGRSLIASYVASQIVVLLGLWAIWSLSRRYLSDRAAWIVLLSVAAYRYFNMGSVNYTTSTPTTPLWVAAIFFLYEALEKDRFRDWLLLGLAVGAGLMCKYSFAILCVTMVGWFLFDPQARRRLKSSGPYWAVLIAGMIFLPHGIWSAQHNLPTLRYASESIAGGAGWRPHVIEPLRFLGSQLFLVVPMLIALIPLLGFPWQLRPAVRPNDLSQKNPPSESKFRFLTGMIALPVLLHLLIAAWTGGHFRTAYGAPLWPLLPLWFCVFFAWRRTDAAAFRTANVLAGIVLAACVVTYWADYQFRYVFTTKPAKIHFPAKSLGIAVDQEWHAAFSTRCRWLSGEWDIAGAAAIHMPERPSVLCYYYGLEPGQPLNGYWGTEADVAREGGMILWRSPDGLPTEPVPAWLAERFPTAVVSPEILVLPYATSAKLTPLKIRFARVPPAENPGKP